MPYDGRNTDDGLLRLVSQIGANIKQWFFHTKRTHRNVYAMRFLFLNYFGIFYKEFTMKRWLAKLYRYMINMLDYIFLVWSLEEHQEGKQVTTVREKLADDGEAFSMRLWSAAMKFSIYYRRTDTTL